uniref:ancestra imine reductase n=1 Tax=synthetic construct TaxID=32630 RepID=UPI0028FC33AC|nr:Chain A, ancestra imine reductase [synthetic construct]8JYT_B Chain B, ancestra imine reductase [synthetic construct]8JYT_C Chain C, ancestra imine reductase [synthetic construct]8JYT_D Chain D, ancestra imine reductase [synthetic construct]
MGHHHHHHMSNNQPVTVIGLGPMGQAMAGAFLAAGHPVTVWNRTPSKADALVAQGAVRAATVAEALAASELVVLSLTDYDAMYAILEPAADALAGRVLVNLSSDTPERAREAAAWAAEHGARYLTGGVMVPPPGIGTPEAYVFYSGPREVFEAHRATLAVLGGTDYVGEDPGLAQLYYQAQLDIFWTTMTAYLHATALVGSEGVPAEEFLPYATEMFDSMSFLEEMAEQIDAGEYPGDEDTLAMGAAGVDHIVHASRDAGIDTALPEAVKALFRRAIAAGHGEDSFTSLIEVLRKPA